MVRNFQNIFCLHNDNQPPPLTFQSTNSDITSESENCLEAMTPMDYIDYWLNSIHAHAAENTAIIENGVHIGSAQPRGKGDDREISHDRTSTSVTMDGADSRPIDLTPPIFIVGTHREGLHTDIDIRQKMVRTLIVPQ